LAKRTRHPSGPMDFQEWLTGRYSRVTKLALVFLVIFLISLVIQRFYTGGTNEIVNINVPQTLNTLIQLYAIINPFTVLPTFISFTGELNESGRNQVLQTTVMIVIALLFSFALFGTLLLRALNVSVASFQLGGGILLMVIAIEMLGGSPRNKSLETDQVAVVPLATPLLVGPGTMTTLIVLTSTEPVINVLAGGLLAAIATYLTLRVAPYLMRVLGPNGIQAVGRLMAIILAAVAANMILNSLFSWGIATVKPP
jgi:multiple antibiotic resistance protein